MTHVLFKFKLMTYLQLNMTFKPNCLQNEIVLEKIKGKLTKQSSTQQGFT